MTEQAFPKGVDQQHRYAPHCHPGDRGGRAESFGNDEEADGMYLRVHIGGGPDGVVAALEQVSQRICLREGQERREQRQGRRHVGEQV